MADDKLMVTMIISIIALFSGVVSTQGASNHCPRATDTKPQEPNTLTPGLKAAAKKVYGSSDGADKNRFCISVRKRKVWEDTFEICDICKSDFNLPLNIRFTGGEAVDLSGPKIEGMSEEKDFREKVLALEERFDVGFNKASVSFGVL